MEIRDMTRAALSGWLKVVRLPIDTAVKVLPNGDRGPRNAAMLAVDRVDASIRATIGSTMNDVELIADAQRRRVAADEREKALSLRVEAEEKREQADARAAQKQREAEQKRAAAERSREEEKQRVASERAQAKRKAEQDAEAQREAAEEARQEQLAKVSTRAKRERLKVLDEKSDALDREAVAVTAQDEAQRLRKATNAAKAARKSQS